MGGWQLVFVPLSNETDRYVYVSGALGKLHSRRCGNGVSTPRMCGVVERFTSMMNMYVTFMLHPLLEIEHDSRREQRSPTDPGRTKLTDGASNALTDIPERPNTQKDFPPIGTHDRRVPLSCWLSFKIY